MLIGNVIFAAADWRLGARTTDAPQAATISTDIMAPAAAATRPPLARIISDIHRHRSTCRSEPGRSDREGASISRDMNTLRTRRPARPHKKSSRIPMESTNGRTSAW
jgi:hypothetical protein